MTSLEGRTAVVTGASRGIGARIAELLAAEGARVALVARTRVAIDDLALRIGNESFGIAADLSDEGDAVVAADIISAHFGSAPDILVNNAGVFAIESLDAMSVANFAAMVKTNLVGPFAMVRGFLPGMKTRGSGHMVTIGSVADRTIFGGNGGYSSTKFGARAMHEVLREETRGTGIRATLVSPSSVDTGIWDGVHFHGTDVQPDRSTMLDATAVADAVIYALTRPAEVNIDELRVSRS